LTQPMEMKWNGQNLTVASPTDAKIQVSLSEKILPRLPIRTTSTGNIKPTLNRVHNEHKIQKATNPQMGPLNRNLAKKINSASTKSKNVQNASAISSVVPKKRKNRISRRKQGELAIQSIHHMFSDKPRNVGMNDEVLKDMKKVFINHPGMNEKAMSDAALLPMNSQMSRFEKISIQNEEWQYSHGNKRTRTSHADKRSRNLTSNHTPIKGQFDVVFDENEDLLTFVQYVFKPYISMDEVLPEIRYTLHEQTYMADDVLECVTLLFDGKLNRVNYIDEKQLHMKKSSSQQHTHIVHQFENDKKSKSSVQLPPLVQKQTSVQKLDTINRKEARTYKS